MDIKKDKIKINEIIIVEGRDDVTALKRVVDAHVIALNGFSGISKKTIEKLKNLSEKNEMILLTDPDFSGKIIRKKISKHIPKIKHAFIARDKAIKIYSDEINIGVENANDESILEALENIISMKESKEEIFNVSDLIDNGLSIGRNAKEKRILLGNLLKIGYYNSKQLLNALNYFNITRNDFEKAMEIVKKSVKSNS